MVSYMWPVDAIRQPKYILIPDLPFMSVKSLNLAALQFPHLDGDNMSLRYFENCESAHTLCSIC